MHRIDGIVQHYAWGDERAIPDLLGVPPDGRPWAEYWLGTHPNGPSTLADGRPLSTVTGPLPFMMKLVAAAQPLSLQAHPDAERARAGYEAGIYPDPYPKPELLCALTPFDALCGIRPVDRTLELLDRLGARDLAGAVDSDGVGPTLGALYRHELDWRSTIAACGAHPHEPAAALVCRLASRYPDDPSVAATLLLNRVSLAPGQAIFLGPGNLHAYLSGTGVEVMGASDNVVRGGLTAKHVDVDELLRIVDPRPLPDPVIDPTIDASRVVRYDTDPAPFVLRRIDNASGDSPIAHRAAGHELLLCTAGGRDLSCGTALHLAPGDHVTIPPSTTVYVTAVR